MGKDAKEIEDQKEFLVKNYCMSSNGDIQPDDIFLKNLCPIKVKLNKEIEKS